MKHYEPQTFDLPAIAGISEKQIEEHLKLYHGYVKHVNTLFDEIKRLSAEAEPNTYAMQELWRRFGFEFNGMRNHEYYFGALEGGTAGFDGDTAVGRVIVEQFGSYDAWKAELMRVATTRGSGWAMTYYDTVAKQCVIGWVDEHHLGGLLSLPIICALDCWEHAYMVDYLPGERKAYIESYLEAMNWDKVNGWFEAYKS